MPLSPQQREMLTNLVIQKLSQDLGQPAQPLHLNVVLVHNEQTAAKLEEWNNALQAQIKKSAQESGKELASKLTETVENVFESANETSKLYQTIKNQLLKVEEENNTLNDRLEKAANLFDVIGRQLVIEFNSAMNATDTIQKTNKPLNADNFVEKYNTVDTYIKEITKKFDDINGSLSTLKNNLPEKFSPPKIDKEVLDAALKEIPSSEAYITNNIQPITSSFGGLKEKLDRLKESLPKAFEPPTINKAELDTKLDEITSSETYITNNITSINLNFTNLKATLESIKTVLDNIYQDEKNKPETIKEEIEKISSPNKIIQEVNEKIIQETNKLTDPQTKLINIISGVVQSLNEKIKLLTQELQPKIDNAEGEIANEAEKNTDSVTKELVKTTIDKTEKKNNLFDITGFLDKINNIKNLETEVLELVSIYEEKLVTKREDLKSKLPKEKSGDPVAEGDNGEKNTDPKSYLEKFKLWLKGSQPIKNTYVLGLGGVIAVAMCIGMAMYNSTHQSAPVATKQSSKKNEPAASEAGNQQKEVEQQSILFTPEEIETLSKVDNKTKLTSKLNDVYRNNQKHEKWQEYAKAVADAVNKNKSMYCGQQTEYIIVRDDILKRLNITKTTQGKNIEYKKCDRKDGFNAESQIKSILTLLEEQAKIHLKDISKK